MPSILILQNVDKNRKVCKRRNRVTIIFCQIKKFSGEGAFELRTYSKYGTRLPKGAEQSYNGDLKSQILININILINALFYTRKVFSDS